MASPEAAATATPVVKPRTDVTASQARSFQVCGSRLSVVRAVGNPREVGRRWTAGTSSPRCHPASLRSTHVVQRRTYANPNQTKTPTTRTRSDVVIAIPVTRMVNAMTLHAATAAV
jgi:hypothetical protein